MRKGFFMKSVAFHNLGCKVNSYEMDVMQQMLVEQGYTVVPFEEKADIYIVNTCTVTNIADRKSRQMLHRAKQLNPDAVVVAVGCYVQTAAEQVEKDEAIDLAIGNNRKNEMVTILEQFLREREEQADLVKSDVLDIAATYEYEEMTLKQTAEHTRAYIKIQDGCNQFCSYCAIPLARGRVRSRKAEDILNEIRGIAAAGYREVVLTGIHISSYGIDFEEESWEKGLSIPVKRTEERLDYSGRGKLLDLIDMVCEVEGIDRVRLGSLEPRVVTGEAAARLAAQKKICPHFHLSLQSGCDETLKRMNRHYTADEYFESVGFLREAFAHPAITTDVIVGFPQESEEEFEKTVAFTEKTNFYEMHVFKYSKRAGTRAAVMKGQIPEQVKGERSARLIALRDEQSKEFRRFYLGKEVEVLLEEEKEISGGKYYLGYTPDYVRVAVPVSEDLAGGSIVRVTAQDFLSDEILLGQR